MNKKSHRLYEFKLVDSKADGLIQLADMVVGSIYRSLQKEKSDSNDYLPLIRKKLDDLWTIKKRFASYPSACLGTRTHG